MPFERSLDEGKTWELLPDGEAWESLGRPGSLAAQKIVEVKIDPGRIVRTASGWLRYCAETNP